MFSYYPGGRPAVALLALRAALGLALLAKGANCLSGASATAWCLLTLLAGALLTIGFLTPVVAGVLVFLVAIEARLEHLFVPSAALNGWLDARWSIVFAAAILIALLLTGPGALSVDARMFRRREIIIPPAPPRHE